MTMVPLGRTCCANAIDGAPAPQKSVQRLLDLQQTAVSQGRLAEPACNATAQALVSIAFTHASCNHVRLLLACISEERLPQDLGNSCISTTLQTSQQCRQHAGCSGRRCRETFNHQTLRTAPIAATLSTSGSRVLVL